MRIHLHIFDDLSGVLNNIQSRRKEPKDDIIQLLFDVTLTGSKENLNGSVNYFLVEVFRPTKGTIDLTGSVVVMETGEEKPNLEHEVWMSPENGSVNQG